MNTSKPISTISYNSLRYHIGVLDELLHDHILSFYAFIPHEGEPSETGDDEKDHFHDYFEPARRIQTEDLRELFKELDPDHVKPLGCQPFRATKWADWYLYVLHDPAYLASKGMSRAYAYTHDQIITSDPDYMRQLISEIDMRQLSPYVVMVKHIRAGHDFTEYMVREGIDIRYTHQYKKAYELLEYKYKNTEFYEDSPVYDSEAHSEDACKKIEG